ncbi:MAG TPA: DUF1178 family protein [Methylocystis sp.]|nr:DUF1178 family protein [Methylocystis sp.]
MIRYSLICARAHEFDAWFRDIANFDDQAAMGALSCPYCNSTEVQKGVMAPHVARSGRSTQGGDGAEQKAPTAEASSATLPAPPDPHRELREKVRDFREKILESTEDVGERFPEEARKIQDGDAPRRAIRGKASLAEAKALLEEGVAVLPLPGEGH